MKGLTKHYVGERAFEAVPADNEIILLIPSEGSILIDAVAVDRHDLLTIRSPVKVTAGESGSGVFYLLKWEIM